MSMIRSLAVLCALALPFNVSPAAAQNPRDLFNTFNGMVQSAVKQAVQSEWKKLPDAEIACMEETLRKRGSSVSTLAERGIPPSDPRIAPERASCRNQVAQSTPATSAIDPQASLYSVDGLTLGTKVAFGSAAYRQYQCVRSEKFEGFVWCTKAGNDREARGPFKVWFSLLHARDGTAVYVNRYQEPAYWGANEIPDDIQRYSKKIGEQPHIVQLPTRPGEPRGTIATWGKVVLEPIVGDELRALAADKPVDKGIALDFIGDFTRSARQGLPVYRLAGGPGFVWAASYDERGRGSLRFSAVDASAYSPQTLPPNVTTPPPVAAAAPDEKAAAFDPSSSSPQILPPRETTPAPAAVLPPGGATAVDPSLSSPQALPGRETTVAPPIAPLPPNGRAAAANNEKTARLGGTEPEPTNPKLDVGGQVGAYVCRLIGSVGATYLQRNLCADPVRISYFMLVLVGIALVSGAAKVSLATALKGNSPSTTLFPSAPSTDATMPDKQLQDPQNSSIIVSANQKANEGQSGVITALTDQTNNSREVTANCRACGAELNATDRFCSACGAPKKSHSQVNCQTCSVELPSDAAFCPNCGAKVSDVQTVPKRTVLLKAGEGQTTSAERPTDRSPETQQPSEEVDIVRDTTNQDGECVADMMETSSGNTGVKALLEPKTHTTAIVGWSAIAVGLLVGFWMVRHADFSALSTPELRVETTGTNGVMVTNIGTTPIEVRSVLVNGRPECTANPEQLNPLLALMVPKLPATIQTGEVTGVIRTCPGNLVSVDVETDHGTGSYRFSQEVQMNIQNQQRQRSEENDRETRRRYDQENRDRNQRFDDFVNRSQQKSYQENRDSQQRFHDFMNR
jgi:hypothetical protein